MIPVLVAFMLVSAGGALTYKEAPTVAHVSRPEPREIEPVRLSETHMVFDSPESAPMEPKPEATIVPIQQNSYVATSHELPVERVQEIEQTTHVRFFAPSDHKPQEQQDGGE